MEREENIRDNIIKLPKIELHCHLDGSLSREFVEKRLGRTVQEAELSVSDDCTSLAQYLEKFDLPGQCIQDEKGLEGAAYDVLKGMHRENVVYAEIRFAPLLSENERMSCERVIEAALKGLERGKKDFGIEYGLIVCAMRHHSEEQNRRMLHTAREFLGAGVCAADLAGAEVPYPMSGFMELFKYAKQLGLPFTIHAGECGNAQNIIDAVEAGADIIMLDNMTPEMMKEAVQLIGGRAKTECSGNVTKENIAKLRDVGVDYVSSGALTHSAPILDISLKNLHPLS